MSRRRQYKFRLYVTGDSPNGAQAIANLTAICEERLADRHKIEIIDLSRDPQRALTDGIFMTPTLLKLAPAPPKRIVGALSQTERVVQTLGLYNSVA